MSTPTPLPGPHRQERGIRTTPIMQNRTQLLRRILPEVRPISRPSVSLWRTSTIMSFNPAPSTYERHRITLHQVSQAFYLPDLLGTKVGIEVRASFLEKSGASTKNGHSIHTLHWRKAPYRLHSDRVSRPQPTRVIITLLRVPLHQIHPTPTYRGLIYIHT